MLTKTTTAPRKIRQILPGDGWYAIYESNNQANYARLVCWALTDEGIEGIDAADYAGFCEDNSNFQGYIHESEIPPCPPSSLS